MTEGPEGMDEAAEMYLLRTVEESVFTTCCYPIKAYPSIRLALLPTRCWPVTWACSHWPSFSFWRGTLWSACWRWPESPVCTPWSTSVDRRMLMNSSGTEPWCGDGDLPSTSSSSAWWRWEDFSTRYLWVTFSGLFWFFYVILVPLWEAELLFWVRSERNEAVLPARIEPGWMQWMDESSRNLLDSSDDFIRGFFSGAFVFLDSKSIFAWPAASPATPPLLSVIY